MTESKYGLSHVIAAYLMINGVRSHPQYGDINSRYTQTFLKDHFDFPHVPYRNDAMIKLTLDDKIGAEFKHNPGNFDLSIEIDFEGGKRRGIHSKEYGIDGIPFSFTIFDTDDMPIEFIEEADKMLSDFKKQWEQTQYTRFLDRIFEELFIPSR
ncbi:hypothetical protein HOG16_02680 [Candidatus Woesearchaeota archaeon]|jgi:hypothetical protein|nr:hypothetical protein [Candidatus Woesearchaeota archaeon]MBT4322003.1 hypothetical protein [Candidatus Woesearchaeota archaeon]MBT4630749.1 hypothetical protein [Candidatus Woesearchaeota archaeon]